MRTAQAQELLEIAFMLVLFHDHGAPVELQLLGWARQMVWVNA